MTDTNAQPPIKDVIDFYARWPDLRPRIVAFSQTGILIPGDDAILDWMITIIDRVGPADLQAEPPEDDSKP